MYSFYFEAGILGYLMGGRRLGEVIYRLTPEDFSDELHRSIFQSVKQLFSQGAPVNAVTVSHEMRTKGYESTDMEKAMREYIKQAAPDINHYVESLLNDNALRRMKDLGNALFYSTSLPAAQEIARDIAKSSTRSANKMSTTATDAAAAFFDRLDKAAEKPPEYIDWCFPPLNKQLYSQLGDFIVVGGRPSAGKTMLALQMALHMAKRYRVGFVSLETSPEKLIDRAMSHLSGVPLWKIKKPDCLGADDYKCLLNQSESFQKLCFEIADTSVRSVSQIEAFALNRRIDVLVIDYLQIIPGNGGSRYEIITNISQELHTLAQTHGICVIALSQLSRSPKLSNKETPPTLESLRESGQLEQDADAVMLLYLENSEDKDGFRILKLAKNKEGKCGKLSLHFSGETQTFTYIGG